MKIKYFCPLWGVKHLPLEQVLEQIKSSGYDGAEIALDPEKDDIFTSSQLIRDFGLELLIQLPYPKIGTPDKMLEDFLSKLDVLLKLDPLMVNCHSGKDHFSFEQNLAFISSADLLSKEHGITVAHETHRGRFSFSPTVIEKYIEAVPDIKLTADFSHWCVVSESLLEDQQHVIDRVIPHCVLIHARVGYAQGPQVPHPGAPEYSKELQQHTKWWKQIAEHHRGTQKQELLITCEFGPPPYMHTIPFTGQAVTSQYEMNLFMKDHLSKNLI
jgi:sugar phosphate isomerase/epimerase